MTDNECIGSVAREFAYVHNIKVKSIKRISRKVYMNATKKANYYNEFFVSLD